MQINSFGLFLAMRRCAWKATVVMLAAVPASAQLNFFEPSMLTYEDAQDIFSTATFRTLQDEDGSDSSSPDSVYSSRRRGPRPQVGDFFSSNRFTFWNTYAGVDGRADFSVPGRTKVAELNIPIPTDRVYFQYSQYHNALESATIDTYGNTLVSRQRSANEYLFGFEKTLFSQWWSIELRMPIFERINSVFDGGAFVSSSDDVGNLSLILKRMLYRSESQALTIGLGLSTPTGGDSTFVGGNQVFSVKNEAVHILPYLMYLWMPGDRFFGELTLQGDIPVSGNRVTTQDMKHGEPPVAIGRLDTQSLLYLTATAGYWVYSNPDTWFISGIAALVEANYSRTLQNQDVISGTAHYTKFMFDNGRNQFDILNLSLGVDVELGNAGVLRIAGVVPLNSADRRFMDSEIKAAIMRSW